MGGGNTSQTATQAPGAAREESKTQAADPSGFKAFKGKGVSLGSDLSN